MFEIENSADMSDMEYIAEFLSQYPEQAQLISQDKFPIFYQYPKDVVKHFKAAINFMKNLQVPDEFIEKELEYHINNACNTVENLKANTSQN